MSVINDMLRDLSQRQAPEVADGRDAVPQSLIEPRRLSVKRTAVAVVLLLIVAGFGVYASNVFNEVKVNSEQQNTIDTQANAATVIAKEAEIRPDMPSQSAVLTRIEPAVNETNTVSVKNTDRIIQAKLDPLQLKPEPIQPIPEQAIEPVSEPIKSSTMASLPEPGKTSAVSKSDAISEQKEIVQAITPSSNEAGTVVSKSRLKPEAASAQDAVSMQVNLSPGARDRDMAEKALLLLKAGKNEQAYRELMAYIASQEVDNESRTVLANYLMQEKRLAEAGDVLLNASIDSSASLRQLKARWYAAMGDHKMALYTLNSKLPEISQYPDYYVLLAAYYQRFGWHRDALKTYTLLIEYDDSIADWWAGLALAADRLKDLKQAVLAYEQALALPGMAPELNDFVRNRLTQIQAAQAGRS